MDSTHLNSEWVGKDLTNLDFRYKDLSARVLFNTNLKGSRLYGAKISLQCSTFDAVKLDDEQVSELLLMFALADIDSRWVTGLRALVEAVVGPDKVKALDRFLRLV